MKAKNIFWAVLSIVGALILRGALVGYTVAGSSLIPAIVWFYMAIGGVFSLTGLVALGVGAFKDKE